MSGSTCESAELMPADDRFGANLKESAVLVALGSIGEALRAPASI